MFEHPLHCNSNSNSNRAIQDIYKMETIFWKKYLVFKKGEWPGRTTTVVFRLYVSQTIYNCWNRIVIVLLFWSHFGRTTITSTQTLHKASFSIALVFLLHGAYVGHMVQWVTTLPALSCTFYPINELNNFLFSSSERQMD